MGFIFLTGDYKKNKMQHHVIVFKGDYHEIPWNVFLTESVGTDKNLPWQMCLGQNAHKSVGTISYYSLTRGGKA